MMNGVSNSLVRGALAGMAGTMAMWTMQMGSQKYLPGTLEPVREDPGAFMVEKAESAVPGTAGDRIPEVVEGVLGQSLHFGYGTMLGTLYTALRPDADNALLDGLALGLGTWAVGYLGWVPAVDLAPPATKHEPQQLVGSLTRHAIYGITTVAVFRQLQNH
jgi:hypothetical protein